MPPKTSSVERRAAAPRKKTLAPNAAEREAVEIVVRRGALRRFDALKIRTGELPVVLTWDRRTNDRRGDTAAVTRDRRQTERRRTPPFTWDLADFVVVEPTKRQKASRKRTSKKS
jgi:hypothetical protein